MLPELQAEPVDADISAALDKAPLSMLFQGKTAEECRLWQKKFKAKLDELLGDSVPPKTWKVTVEEVVVLEGGRGVRHRTERSDRRGRGRWAAAGVRE